jgi:hypothetical protein
MAGTKTKKVTLTVKNPPRAQTKRRKGRNNATSDSPATTREMGPSLLDIDIDASIEDEGSAGGIDLRLNRGLPRVDIDLEVDTTTADGVPTVQNLEREFNLVKGQLWTTSQVWKID